MKNALRLTLNAPYATVILIVAADTLVPLCAQIPSHTTLQVFDPGRPDLPLYDGVIEQFATDLGCVILPNKVQLPKADYQRLQGVAKAFWEARGGRTENGDPAKGKPPSKAPVADADRPTWSKRSRSAEVQVETVAKPYTHVREPAPFSKTGQRGAQVTVILVPANKGDGRVVFDDATWRFKPGPPVPGTNRAEQGLKAILRDEWAAKQLNAALDALSSVREPAAV